MPSPLYGTNWRKRIKPVKVTATGRIKLPFSVTALLLLVNAQLFVAILVLYLIYEAVR